MIHDILLMIKIFERFFYLSLLKALLRILIENRGKIVVGVFWTIVEVTIKRYVLWASF
jgi:hypothetical protein